MQNVNVSSVNFTQSNTFPFNNTRSNNLNIISGLSNNIVTSNNNSNSRNGINSLNTTMNFLTVPKSNKDNISNSPRIREKSSLFGNSPLKEGLDSR